MKYHERLEGIIAGKGQRPEDEVMSRANDVIVTDVGIIDYFDGMIPMVKFNPVEFTDPDDYTDETFHTTRQVLDTLEIGLHISRSMFFEGEISEGPYMSVIAAPIHMDRQPIVVVTWKQSNNGHTWMASNIVLPYDTGISDYGWTRDGHVVTGKHPPVTA